MYIKRYIIENKFNIYLYITLIIIGVIFGICLFDKISVNEKNEIANLYKNSVKLNNQSVETVEISNKIIKYNLQMSIVIIMMGLFVFGRFGLLFCSFFIGLNVGINNSIIYSLLNNNTWIKVAIFYTIINILYIIIYGILVIFNYNFSKDLYYLIDKENIKKNIIMFSIYNILIIFLLIIPIVFEIVLNHNLLNNII